MHVKCSLVPLLSRTSAVKCNAVQPSANAVQSSASAVVCNWPHAVNYKCSKCKFNQVQVIRCSQVQVLLSAVKCKSIRCKCNQVQVQYRQVQFSAVMCNVMQTSANAVKCKLGAVECKCSQVQCGAVKCKYSVVQ